MVQIPPRLQGLVGVCASRHLLHLFNKNTELYQWEILEEINKELEGRVEAMVVGGRAEPVIMLTSLDTFKETLGQFPANVSGNQMDAYGYFWRDVRASPAVFAVTKPSILIHNRSFY